MLKAELNCNRTKVNSTKAWEGRRFLQVLATAIGGIARARIKLYNESAKRDKKKYRVHCDSDHKLLAKLQNIYMTQFSAGFMFDEVVGKKKELFKILNVPVPTVEQVIAHEPKDIDLDEQCDLNKIAARTYGDDLEDL